MVVSSTSARGYVLARADVDPTMRASKGRPLFLIIIAVPRDLDPTVHELDGCYLYDIDDLEAVVEASPGEEEKPPARRRSWQPRASASGAWRASRMAPAIVALRAQAEEIRGDELERAPARWAVTDAELEVVEAITARIVDKLLHLTVRLKEAAAGADGVWPTPAPGRCRHLGRDPAAGLALTQAERAADPLRRPGIEMSPHPDHHNGDHDRRQPFGRSASGAYS